MPAGEPVVPIVERLHPAAMDAAADPMATAAPTGSATATLAPAVTRVAPATAVPTPAPEHKPAVAVDDSPIPSTLGGYQVERPLGQGGMGAVYLARQTSLDRNVALKVLNPALAADAGFVARFTREAYAAAQLTHHNVVQVYDIGADKGRHFYAMEFVEGQTLAGIVAKDGRLDPAVAVGYALQAARGLGFAHGQGLIHRDVKPDNLMVNDHGIVKVADLGLVKKRGVSDPTHSRTTAASPAPGHHSTKLDQAQAANSTGFLTSMGTPAYMAPEQARDAARVDARADVYSLGCTLYDMLTGRPPFTGRSATEVIAKHATETVVPPERLAPRVPPELSVVVQKMVAKQPGDRYRTMADCARALEDFLGVSSPGGKFTPKEEHAMAVERAAKVFANAPLAQVRRWVGRLFLIGCAVAAVAAAVLGRTLAGRIGGVGTVVGLCVLTVASYLVLVGITRRDVVLLKARQFAFGARIVDWLKLLFALAVGVMLLNVFGLLWTWVGVAVVGIGLAAAVAFGLDLPRDAQRKPYVLGMHKTLRAMRLHGLDEDALRQFVCRYAGHHWEEFYEALFGYEAKMAARARWSTSLRGRPRPTFAPWRDKFVAWVDGRAAARQDRRARRTVAKAEERRLRAKGYEQSQARRKARGQADEMLDKIDKLRQTVADARAETDRRHASTIGPSGQVVVVPSDSFYAAAVDDHRDDAAPSYRRSSRLQRMHGGPLGLVFGPTVRFPIAVTLVAAFALWFHQNNPDFPRDAARSAQQSFDAAHDSLSGVRTADVATASRLPVVARPVGQHDLDLPGVPRPILRAASGYAVGLAGALLLLSCLSRSWKVGLLALVGSTVTLIGDRYLPGVGPPHPRDPRRHRRHRRHRARHLRPLGSRRLRVLPKTRIAAPTHVAPRSM